MRALSTARGSPQVQSTVAVDPLSPSARDDRVRSGILARAKHLHLFVAGGNRRHRPARPGLPRLGGSWRSSPYALLRRLLRTPCSGPPPIRRREADLQSKVVDAVHATSEPIRTTIVLRARCEVRGSLQIPPARGISLARQASSLRTRSLAATTDRWPRRQVSRRYPSRSIPSSSRRIVRAAPSHCIES
jgi:hypothetical protein